MSVVSAVNPGTFARTTPYISIDMFKNHARAGVSVENLVPKGDAAQQDYALAMLIEEASAWIDSEALQTFAAHQDTWVGQVNVDNRGMAVFSPPVVPVIGVTGVSLGPLPNQMRALASLTGIAVTDHQVKVPVYPGALLTSSEGPIQFGSLPAPWTGAYGQLGYVGGYPVTALTADVAAGALSLPVADTAGIVQGKTWLTVYALQGRFSFLAGTVSTADAGGLGFGAGTVGCSAAPANISNSAMYPVVVSALPSDLIAANVLVTRALIKQKGSGAVASTSASSRSPKQGRQNAGDDFAEAWEIVNRHLNPVGDFQQ